MAIVVTCVLLLLTTAFGSFCAALSLRGRHWEPFSRPEDSDSLHNLVQHEEGQEAVRVPYCSPMPSRPTLYGHRGAGCSGPLGNSLFPENSFQSMRNAEDVGLDGAELDVWLTKDNEVVVLHGEGDNSGFLTETVEVPLELAEMSVENLTWDELRNLKLRQSPRAKKISPFDTNERIPRLRDLLRQFENSPLQFNVELKGNKTELGPKVLEILWEFPNKVSRISSFNFLLPESIEKPNNEGVAVDLLECIVHNAMGVPLALLFDDSVIEKLTVDEIGTTLKKYNSQWVHVRFSIFGNFDAKFNEFVEDMHAIGAKVMTWWGAEGQDRPEDVRRSLQANVDSLCVNDADVAKEIYVKEVMTPTWRRRFKLHLLCYVNSALPLHTSNLFVNKVF